MKRKMLSIQSLNADVANLFLRLIFGGLFVYFGTTKLASYDQILPMFGDIIGIGPKLSFNLVIFAEPGCGFLVLVGFLTRLSVIPIFITMLIAFFIAHAHEPFPVKAFVFLLLSIVIFISGSGKYSIDAFLFKERQTAGTVNHYSIVS